MSRTLIIPRAVVGLALTESMRSRAILRCTESAAPAPAAPRAAPPPAAPKPPPPPDPEAIKRAARAQAQVEYDERLKQARAQLEQEFTAKLAAARRDDQARLAARLAELDGFLEQLKRQIAAELVPRALQLAEIVLRHELPDRAMLADLLQKTLEPISDLQGARVRMHPGDHELLVTRDGTGPAYAGRVDIVADPALKPGDLVVESRNGIFDGRLETRIGMLRDLLQKQVGNRYAGNT